jgi:bifunctional DNA-binding transcriptional regulator/antitoxin component of YhaV-PrlF toxin-antitoxin module
MTSALGWQPGDRLILTVAADVVITRRLDRSDQEATQGCSAFCSSFGGPTEIMKEIIGHSLGLYESDQMH